MVGDQPDARRRGRFHCLSVSQAYHFALSGMRTDHLHPFDVEGRVRLGREHESDGPFSATGIAPFPLPPIVEGGQVL